MIKIVFAVFLTCLVFSCAEVNRVHQHKKLPSAIPSLTITNLPDTTVGAMKISSLSIDVVVAANIATTTFDITFYNPNSRVLEGEFEFPLADGQHITRYALDMNGQLREGVVVEKAKARVAFENTVRRGIDPGLVEKTKGNNFRTRIYPLPAQGYKRVVIAIEQTLEQENKDLVYQLPLYAKEQISQFALKVTVLKSTVKPQLDENGLADFFFTKWNEAYVAEHKQANFTADKTIAFSLPGTNNNNDIVLTEDYEGQTYFYVNSRVEPRHIDKKTPASIGLFWDISASGNKRDLEKEITLLTQYLQGINHVTVSLIPFNIYTRNKEEFEVSDGNISQLINRIRSLDYDGGTQLGAIDFTRYKFDEALLFSDGLSTFGKQDVIFSKIPVTTITTSPSADYSSLKFIAGHSHGMFIDLGRQEVGDALKELNGQSLQVIHISYDPAAIEDVATQTTPILNTGLSFAGKLKTGSATVKVDLGFGNEVVMTKEFTITEKDSNDYDQVKRAWASMKINQLDLEYEKNKDAITDLGKEFSVVTQNTSLLVLDRLEDYVQYEITPPADMQKEYFAQLKDRKRWAIQEKDMAMNDAISAMARLKAWWNIDYSKRKVSVDNKNVDEEIRVPEIGLESQALGNSNGFLLMDSTRGAATYFSTAEGVADQAVTTPGEGTYKLEAMTDADGVADKFAGEERKESPEEKSTIELNEWKPDEKYLKILERTDPAERFSKYLSLKKEYRFQPSFYIDVARFFIDKKENALGIQILSNVSEMKLEDAELLRMVANQLQEAGEKELAVITFEQVLKMREEDPQSYRDLALVYNETGEYNKSLDLFYQLVLGTWDGRFGDVKGIALNEMNAIISAHPGLVNTSDIDGRLIYAMPVDVRIVVGWNTDNSDIDLWVTDPKKEKCFYQNQETRIGGHLSADVTQGYGPEEFLLKKALNGNYTVDVNLYGDHRQTLGGPIAIKADLFTDFGKPTQKRSSINLRVTSNKEVINLGKLKFGI
jgi:hypothetical protein